MQKPEDRGAFDQKLSLAYDMSLYLRTHFSCSYLQKTRIRLHPHFIMYGFHESPLFLEVLFWLRAAGRKGRVTFLSGLATFKLSMFR